MNIGIVTTWFERGASYVSLQFMEALQSAGHNLFVYARGGEEYAIGDPKWDQDNVTWGAPPPSYIPTDIDKTDFSRWLSGKQIECVLFNEQKCWEPVITCRELGVKTASYIDYYTEKMLPAFGIYDFLVCNTKKHHSAFDWHPQAHYIPWGTDLKVYDCNNHDPDDDSGVVFFHSAGMSPYRKGTDILLSAVEKLHGEFKVLIHTQVCLLSAFPKLRPLIEKLKKLKRLEIVEGTISAPGLFHRGHVYVYPSRLEGIGLTIAEAAASGLPVIVPNEAPMNEFLKPDETGVVVPVSKRWCRSDAYYWPMCEVSATELAKPMQQFINDTRLVAEFSARVKSFAGEHLDWNKNRNQLSEIFTNTKILDEPPAGAIARARRLDTEKHKILKKNIKTKVKDGIRVKYPKVFNLLLKAKVINTP